jgi:transposase
MVQRKNRVSGLLRETGVSYNKQRLHKVGYFRELLSSPEEVHESIRPLLKLSRETIVRLQKTEYGLVITRCWKDVDTCSPFRVRQSCHTNDA